MTTHALRRSASLLLIGAAIVAARTSAQRAAPQPAPPNFDIRTTKTPEAVSYLTRLTAPSVDAATATARLTTLAGLDRLGVQDRR